MPHLPIFFAALAAPLLIGCTKPCETLRKKVCDDPIYFKANSRHCELMTDKDRFEALSGTTCDGILHFLAKR